MVLVVGDKPMIRKVQGQRDLRFVFIPKAFIEILGLEKGQKVDVRIENEKITVVPVPAAKPKTGTASDPQKVPA